MAKRFRFRLDTILRLRKRILEERQVVVAKRLQAIAIEQGLVSQARELLADEAVESRAMQGQGSVNVSHLRSYRMHSLYLGSVISECNARMAAHERELERERQEMVEASVAVKAIEKLKERRLQRHQRQLAKEEQMQQEEFYAQMHFPRGERQAVREIARS